MTASSLLTVDLDKTFKMGGHDIKAVQKANIEGEPGELIAIMGPSGSGKTTLLSLIGCLDKPSGGKVIIDDVDVTDISESSLYKTRRRKIGFIFQTFNLIESLNAAENVELPMENTIKSRAERREKALKLLALVGLKDREKHRPTQLSAGEQQRVAIARALANDPTIVLADEPTGSLDSETGLSIVKTLRQLSDDKKCVVIMVTHDNLMASQASRIISMRDGKLAG
jgi:putative ABC transport system ATP-binding protein